MKSEIPDSPHCRLTNLIQNFLIGSLGGKTIGIGRHKYTIGMYAKGISPGFPAI